MTRPVPQWLDVQGHISLALEYWKAGADKAQLLKDLKKSHYLVNVNGSISKVNGVQIVAHMELLDRLNNGVRAGKVKCTKKGGLQY